MVTTVITCSKNEDAFFLQYLHSRAKQNKSIN